MKTRRQATSAATSRGLAGRRGQTARGQGDEAHPPALDLARLDRAPVVPEHPWPGGRRGVAAREEVDGQRPGGARALGPDPQRVEQVARARLPRGERVAGRPRPQVREQQLGAQAGRVLPALRGGPALLQHAHLFGERVLRRGQGRVRGGRHEARLPAAAGQRQERAEERAAQPRHARRGPGRSRPRHAHLAPPDGAGGGGGRSGFPAPEESAGGKLAEG